MGEALREYVYISGHKVQALAHAMPSQTLTRLRDISVSFAGTGVALGMSEPAKRAAHHAVVEIEKAIRALRPTKTVMDPALRAGDWVGASEAHVAYGVPSDVMSGQAAVFLTRIADVQLVMCGSAQYLLDRQPPQVEVTHSMSAPSTIGQLLSIAATGTAPTPQVGRDAEASRQMPHYAFANLFRELTQYAPQQPMAFFARVTHAYPSDQKLGPERVVAATPLYVALV